MLFQSFGGAINGRKGLLLHRIGISKIPRLQLESRVFIKIITNYEEKISKVLGKSVEKIRNVNKVIRRCSGSSELNSEKCFRLLAKISNYRKQFLTSNKRAC